MKRRALAGYTMLEIMISVVVMTIGATGILAMQGASVRSNQDASETTVAINFATTWMERIKRDARSWNLIGTADLGGTNTQYLKLAATANGVWSVPTTTAPESAGADYFGFDTPVGATPDLVRYCVNVRFTQAHTFSGSVDAVRADVVVWWHRSSSRDTSRANATCATALTASQIASVTADDRKLRKHFLSTLVTWRDMSTWP